jgi:uncharacterized membrane protein (UPF0127 family)
MKLVLIENQSQPRIRPIKAQYCGSFLCRLRGLMFRRSFATHEGLLMVQAKADRIESSIHMLFMTFDLAVIWLNDEKLVVDVQLCRRWRPAYIPASSARFVLEAHVDRFDDFKIGDVLSIRPCD